MSAPLTPEPVVGPLAGCRILLVGRLAGMNRREARALVREQGGVVVDRFDAEVRWLVVGEGELPLGESGQPSDLLRTDIQNAVARGSTEILSETQFWQRLGLVDVEQNIHRLYTPAMLAELLHVPVAVIRQWHRRGLLRPVREVRRLPYFDFQEVMTARRLAELVAAGASPQVLVRNLEALRKLLPDVERPLAQLSVLIEGKQLLLRQGAGLVEPGGQRRFDFESDHPSDPDRGDDDAAADPSASQSSLSIADRRSADPRSADRESPQALVGPPRSAAPDELADYAAELEDAGQLHEAVETYRAALAAGGPQPQLTFALAELLYRIGDLTAARERYYMAIELDENYVEARCNLGCVLAECGEEELALAAFTGALAYHPDYPDAHYHLAQVLEQLDRAVEAKIHWQLFLQLAPDSPWAEHARQRLEWAEPTHDREPD